MKTESVDDFLKRGGQIKKVEADEYRSDHRSDFSAKDKIDVALKRDVGANKMFNRFVNGFLGRGNNNWKFKAKSEDAPPWIDPPETQRK